MNHGFSLVELSIVLVILGLLTGGILAGQSLIRASELRAVSTEYNRYIAATQTFRDKYFGLPGDLATATKFWGAEPAANCPGDQTTPSTTALTCNGDGNGTIVWQTAVAGQGGESHRFWQHLANAGLIEGSYTGVHSAGTCNTNGSCNVTIGQNAPASRLGRAGWSIASGTTISYPAYSGRNQFYFGTANNFTNGLTLTPAEAWNIDTKVDDGMPALGNVSTPTATGRPNCASNDTTAATYMLNVESQTCNFIILATP